MRDRLRELSRRFGGTLLRPWYGGVGCILCLHRIVPLDHQSPLRQNRALELSPGSLRELLDWVCHAELDVIRVEEVPSRLRSPRGTKFVAFTFDDGYRDNLWMALPVFRDFGMPFTVNVTTGFINHTTPVWWYSLEDALMTDSRLAFAWRDQKFDFQFESNADRERTFDRLAELILQQGPGTRDELVEAICDATGIDPHARTRDLMLGWDDLRTMSADWHVNIGSHGAAHHNLARLTDEEVESELIDARAELEARLDFSVWHAAYPFGDAATVGRRDFELSRDADFTTVTTSRTGNLFHAHAWHLQALPRLRMCEDLHALARWRDLESGLLPARENGWRRVIVE